MSTDFKETKIENSPQSVLVVEDDPISGLVVRRVLEDLGYSVDLAENGIQALDMLDRNQYRIIVSDWMMPQMDGIELCSAVRARKGPYIYFLLLTAKNQRNDRAAAFEAGVDDMFSKPLDREELISRLKVGNRILNAESELQKVSECLKHTNSSLQFASRRFEELFHRLPVACFTFSTEGTIHEWNQEAEKSFGVEAPFSFMRPVEEVLGDRSAGFWGEQTIADLLAGNAFDNCEWSLSMPDGSLRSFVGATYPVIGSNGTNTGMISANVDITDRVEAERRIEEQMIQLAEMNRKLELLSITDGLTGLRNHRFFQETLEEALHALTPEDRPVSLILLDVDHFKKFNDSFGHVAGDAVLKTVASVLKENVKEPGLPARYGGEEFAVVLPGYSMFEAMRVAETIRGALESQNWTDRLVTGSFGVSTTTDPNMKPKSLIEQADEALYRSKEGGRNCVTHWNEPKAHDQKAA